VLFGDEHVQRYQQTDGAEGHEWRPGVFTLLLTTTGRRSGDQHTTPLIYGEDDADYVVVASKGGADGHPDWYVNLREHPEVQVQVGPDVFAATARTVDADEKARLWPLMADIWPDYDHYAEKTDRDIPVVVLEPHAAEGAVAADAAATAGPSEPQGV
jgi:deazaflavin-dependent oxidoreductase (nitroreductase family)